MTNENFIEKLAAGFGQSASVKNVFGEPIQAGDKTIIPVAKITYGLGGGFGQSKKNKKQLEAVVSPEEAPVGEGAGGGGGLLAIPKGVYEITPACTRFIPANGSRQLLLGIVAGMLLKSLFFSGRRK